MSQDHPECFGTMFPDVLHVENDRWQRGKVFSILLERAGGMIRSNREVAADDRPLAAMRALCDLSKRTQVLFFTHHRHLIDLATRHLPTKRVFFHDLGPREPRSVLELF